MSVRGAGPMHWRGDRTGQSHTPDETLEMQAFEDFNVAFTGLLGRILKREHNLRPLSFRRLGIKTLTGFFDPHNTDQIRKAQLFDRIGRVPDANRHYRAAADVGLPTGMA